MFDFPAWLPNCFPGAFGTHKRTARKKNGFSLVLERLEDRVVPTLVITPTWDSSITSDPNAAKIENSIDLAIQAFENTYSGTNETVNIVFKEMNTGLGQSSTYVYEIMYSQYYNALENRANPDADDTSALASIPNQSTDPVIGGTEVEITGPLARALGFNANPPTGDPDSTISLNTSICNLDRNVPGDYNASNYDLIAVASHEIDEALAGGSALDGSTNGGPTPTIIEPLDLFRYSGDAVRSFTTAAPNGNANQAYFSINGGVTDLVNFNQEQGGDFGDWFSNNGSGNEGGHRNSTGAGCLRHRRLAAEPEC